MNQDEFDKRYGKLSKDKKDIKSNIISKIKRPTWYKKRLYNFFPILKWLPKYDFKDDLISDIIGGLTVGIMHVPQGMAYATLAGVEPIYGLYSSFFASLVYIFFGTSRHISIGTFAVGSMMVGAVRFKYIPDMNINHGSDTLMDNGVISEDYDVMTLMSTLTLTVGIVQLVMGIFRLSFLTTYISDQLISGYTTATAVHVFVSQLNKVIGTKLPRHSGNGMLVLMLKDIIFNLHKTNLIPVFISIFGIAFLYIGKQYINPIVKKKSPVPIPFELLLVIIGIILSTTFNLKDDHHVKVVDHIQQGFPSISLPMINLIPTLLFDAIPIAIICYMFAISLGKLFAKKHGYKVDPTQELFALGFMEVFSSIFPVYPTGAALSRSSVSESSGVRYQLYNVFSGTLLLTVIVWIGPILEPLPMCILSAIVIHSLKPLFLQVLELPKLWRISKYDFTIWVISCLATLFTTVTLGLFISIGFVIMSVILRQQWPNMEVLGSDETGTVYKSNNRYSKLSAIKSNLVVLNFEAPLCFVNTTKYLDGLAPHIDGSEDELDEVVVEPSNNTKSKTIILDCSSITFIDSMGLEALKQSYQIAKNHNKKLVFAGFNLRVLKALEVSDLIDEIDSNSIFPSVSEAIAYYDI